MNFNIDDFLPYQLSLAANTVSRRLGEIYAPHDLTRTQWRVLAVLSGASMSAGEISMKTMMDKTTLSRAIKKLEVRGLVRRAARQSDGRTLPLMLSAKGRTLFAQLAPLATQREQALKSKLTTDEIKVLTHILDKLVD